MPVVNVAETGESMKIKEIITVLFLLAGSWKDMKEREISLLLTAVYGVCGILCSVYEKRRGSDFLLTLCIGLFFLGVSLVTSGELGLGDSWTLLALGMMLDTGDYIRMLCTGLILAALYSGGLLMKKKNRKTEIPLLPFLLAGYIGGMVI